MANTVSYNMRSPAVKRLLQEARELQQDKCGDYTAQPLEDNLFEWHFVIRGPDDTEFEGGRYHGRILLPSEYPFKPPNLMLMTPNGRFELNKKICLSITGYHPEYWLPAWGIRTVLLGLLGFMTTKANGAIGGIDYSESERKLLAQRSRSWKCATCGMTNLESLPDDDAKSVVNTDSDVPQFSFVYEEQKDATKADSSKDGDDSSHSRPEIINPESVPSPEDQPHHHHQQRQRPTHEPNSTPSPISVYVIDAMIVILVSIVIALLAKKLS